MAGTGNESAVVAYAVGQLPSQGYKFELFNSGNSLGLDVTETGTWDKIGENRVKWAGSAPEIVNGGASAVSVNAVHIRTAVGATPSASLMFKISHATQSLDPSDRIIYDPINVDFNT